MMLWQEASTKTLYEYLLDNYKENEPIFLADLQIDGMARTNVCQQVKKLADTGKVRRFNNGIYFLPQKTFFKSGSQLAPEKVLVCKYLRDKDKRCGYVSGLMFFLTRWGLLHRFLWCMRLCRTRQQVEPHWCQVLLNFYKQINSHLQIFVKW